MYQHVSAPTRVRGQDRPSTLDLVLTNEELMIEDLEIGAPIGNSDHASVTFEYICHTTRKSFSGTKYLYHKGNYAKLREEMSIDWSAAFRSVPEDETGQYEVLLDLLMKAQELNIPKLDSRLNTGRKRRTFPVSTATREAMRKKNRMWQRFLETREPDKLQAYRRQRNKVRRLTRKAKRDFEATVAAQAKTFPKKFWRYAKSKLSVKEGIGDLVKQGETDAAGAQAYASSDADKAEVLSSFFSSVFTTEPDGPTPQMERREPEVPCIRELSHHNRDGGQASERSQPKQVTRPRPGTPDCVEGTEC